MPTPTAPPAVHLSELDRVTSISLAPRPNTLAPVLSRPASGSFSWPALRPVSIATAPSTTAASTAVTAFAEVFQMVRGRPASGAPSGGDSLLPPSGSVPQSPQRPVSIATAPVSTAPITPVIVMAAPAIQSFDWYDPANFETGQQYNKGL